MGAPATEPGLSYSIRDECGGLLYSGEFFEGDHTESFLGRASLPDVTVVSDLAGVSQLVYAMTELVSTENLFFFGFFGGILSCY